LIHFYKRKKANYPSKPGNGTYGDYENPSEFELWRLKAGEAERWKLHDQGSWPHEACSG